MSSSGFCALLCDEPDRLLLCLGGDGIIACQYFSLYHLAIGMQRNIHMAKQHTMHVQRPPPVATSVWRICVQRKRGPNYRSSLCLISSVANYSATTLSQATLSQQTLSQATLSQATLSQQTALSQAVLSAHSLPVVLLPQEAKDTATIAANTNANFFIFVTF